MRDNQSRTYTVTATFENGVNATLVSREAQAAVEALTAQVAELAAAPTAVEFAPEAPAPEAAPAA